MTEEGKQQNSLSHRVYMVSRALCLFLGMTIIVSCAAAACNAVPSSDMTMPVVRMEVDPWSREPHAAEFELRYSGTYLVKVLLKLREGPTGKKDSYQHYIFAGTAAILDGDHVLLRQEFKEGLIENEIGKELFVFKSRDIGVGERRTFILTLELSPQFVEHYSEITLHVRKKPGFFSTY